MSNIPTKNPKVNKPKDNRARVFATEFYPDSMAPDLFEKLAELHVPCFVSPLHDKDINPDGEVKKAHYHCVLMFQGKKTLEQVQEMIAPLGAVGCLPVKDSRAYCRYLCHLDNPEKHQYDTGEVKAFGGADYSAVITLGADKYKAVREMCAFVEQNNILSYRQLLAYCAENRDDWFRCLCDTSSIVMLEYIKSRFWEEYKMENEIAENWRARQ